MTTCCQAAAKRQQTLPSQSRNADGQFRTASTASTATKALPSSTINVQSADDQPSTQSLTQAGQ